MTFRGVIPPSVTVFVDHGLIDETRLPTHVEWLLASSTSRTPDGSRR